MGLLYAIFSIFITLFFPKQITNVICYGRHRDRENIKSKKIYCLIYVFWTSFFGLFCLMMGSASGEIDVVSETKRIYYIYEKGEVIAKVVVENDGLLKKLSYQWSREKLERNLGG